MVFALYELQGFEPPKKEVHQEEQARRKYRRTCDDAARAIKRDNPSPATNFGQGFQNFLEAFNFCQCYAGATPFFGNLVLVRLLKSD